MSNYRQEHRDAVLKEAAILREQGYKVLLTDDIRPDIIARKGGIVIAKEIELGNPNRSKYEDIDFFDEVIWLTDIKEKRIYLMQHLYLTWELIDRIREYAEHKYGSRKLISIVIGQALDEFLDKEGI